jgi:hypothetical protein
MSATSVVYPFVTQARMTAFPKLEELFEGHGYVTFIIHQGCSRYQHIYTF